VFIFGVYNHQPCGTALFGLVAWKVDKKQVETQYFAIFWENVPYSHTDIKILHMIHNNGDNKKMFHAAMHDG